MPAEREAEQAKTLAFSFSRFPPARSSAQIISRQYLWDCALGQPQVPDEGVVDLQLSRRLWVTFVIVPHRSHMG
jgi:hypothetical protein